MNRLKRKVWCTLTAVFMMLAVMLVTDLSSGDSSLTLTVYAADDITVTIYNESEITLEDTDEDGYYEISSANELCAFAVAVNGGSKSINGELTADIDMKDIPWITICETGLYFNEYGNDCDYGYSGIFDGNGHVISNLTVTSSTSMNASVGLFGTVSGTVKNLGMVTFTLVDGEWDMRAGAIVGQLITSNGKVSNCYVNGATIETGDHVAGGIAGCVYEGTVENCYVVGATITGHSGRFGYVTGDVCADGNDGDGTDRPGLVVNCFTDGSDITSGRKGAASVDGGEAEVTAERFKSGEIAYLLNNLSSEGVIWYQTIDADAYPVLDNTHKTVYCGYEECKSVYANSEAELSKDPAAHTWSNGVCSVCETKCTHNWSEYVCTICQMTCEQHDWENGTCSICSKECAHAEYDTNGLCIECGLGSPAQLVGDTHHPELKETHSGYYAIENAGQLYWFAEQVNSGSATINAVLTDDIIVNDGEFSMDGNDNLLYNGKAIDGTNNPRVWTPIGNRDNKYMGKFDGNNHTVSGLYYNNHVDYVGFFGYTSGSDTEIKNVGVVNSYFYGWSDIGGVCGFNAGNISNCYNTGIIRGDYCVGGVCGTASRNVSNCYNAGSIKGSAYVGGVSGYVQNCKISNCYNAGSIKGSDYVGGVCGNSEYGGVIENSYNTGNVSGTSNVGGVCGRNQLGSTITNCYYNNSDNSINNIGLDKGTATCVEGKTTDEFASGEVAYLLNGTVTDGEWAAGAMDGTQSWYQNLSGTAADACPVLNSGHGTVYKVDKYACTNPEESLGAGYSNTYEEGYKLKVHTGEVIDGYCAACAYAADPIGVHLAGYSLSLSGNIGVNFYMALDASVLADDTAYMQFTLPNKPEPVKVMVSDVKDSPVNVSGKDYYVFTCEVAAKEMADTITAQMFCESGTKSGTVYTYSVEDYAKALIVREGAESKAGKLAKALLNYGAYAEIYFEGNTSIEADTPSVTITKNIYDTYKASVTDNSDKVEYLGSTLLLESKIKVRHYFSTDAVTAEDNDLNEYDTGIYYYESDGIAAANMGTQDACKVDDLTVNYSPMTYVVTVLANNAQELVDDTDLQNLMKALYLYYEAVVAYNN